MKKANAYRNLTRRQQQVVRLAVRGHTDREIAKRLKISPRTVAVHLQIVFKELRIHRRMQLVGLVPKVGRLPE